jgi:hypothetical protein
MNDPLVERHSINFSALEEFKPAILLKMYNKKNNFQLLLMLIVILPFTSINSAKQEVYFRINSASNIKNRLLSYVLPMHTWIKTLFQ